VLPGGQVEIVAKLGGGPNGAAIGPDGHCYVCNNGGMEWQRNPKGFLNPGMQPADYSGGRIEKVDLKSGEFQALYTHCGDLELRSPNDLVFDTQGGFWFTDNGKTRERERDRTGVFYALADGSHIEEAIPVLVAPNGIGLSPDENTLYVAETPTGRLWAYPLEAPGKIDKGRPREMMAQIPDFHMFDSLAVDAEGNICVATLFNGGITIHSPDGKSVRHIAMADRYTTNICFGGEGLRTAFITLSSTGKLVSCEWETSGLPLNFLNK